MGRVTADYASLIHRTRYVLNRPGRLFLHPGYLLPQFENLSTLRTLAEKLRIMAALSQLPRPDSKQRAEEILMGSEGWLCSAEFLEFAPRDELEKHISLVQGHIPDAILKVERVRRLRAVSHTARGRFGNSPGRPRRRSARSWLPGWRTGQEPVGAAMKRGTGLSQSREVFGKSRDGAPQGERAPHSRWFAATRIVRGALRTGRGFGCAHPKRRCGS